MYYLEKTCYKILVRPTNSGCWSPRLPQISKLQNFHFLFYQINYHDSKVSYWFHNLEQKFASHDCHTFCLIFFFLKLFTFLKNCSKIKLSWKPLPFKSCKNALQCDSLLFNVINNAVMSWIKSYLAHRSFYVNLNGTESSVFQLFYGVP